MIIIDTMGGLANRIRSAVSGLILGQALGEQVIVRWAPKPGVCPAAHHQLYARSNPTTFVEQFECDSEEDVWRVHWRRGIPKMFGQQPDYSNLKRPLEIPAEILACRARTIRIRTPWNFSPPGITWDNYAARYCELLNRHFQPLDHGSESVEPPSHGIHIRRGDKTSIMRQRILGTASNPARCERAMRRILRSDPRSSILLCTDDAGLKRQLCDSLGDRVRQLGDGPLSRDTVDGMRFAASELYALGQVGTVLGDGDSTFGPTAAQYRNVPYINLAPSVHSRGRRLLYSGYEFLRETGERLAHAPRAVFNRPGGDPE